MKTLNRSQALVRLRYSLQHAPWMFAACGAMAGFIFARLIPIQKDLILVAPVLGVGLGLYLSRLYVALAGGLWLLLQDQLPANPEK